MLNETGLNGYPQSGQNCPAGFGVSFPIAVMRVIEIVDPYIEKKGLHHLDLNSGGSYNSPF
jgi:hypothetical protein